jgi:hypothetical protein
MRTLPENYLMKCSRCDDRPKSHRAVPVGAYLPRRLRQVSIDFSLTSPNFFVSMRG